MCGGAMEKSWEARGGVLCAAVAHAHLAPPACRRRAWRAPAPRLHSSAALSALCPAPGASYAHRGPAAAPPSLRAGGPQGCAQRLGGRFEAAGPPQRPCGGGEHVLGPQAACGSRRALEGAAAPHKGSTPDVGTAGVHAGAPPPPNSCRPSPPHCSPLRPRGAPCRGPAARPGAARRTPTSARSCSAQRTWRCSGGRCARR